MSDNSSICHTLHAHDSLEMDTNNKYKDSYGWEKILGGFWGASIMSASRPIILQR